MKKQRALDRYRAKRDFTITPEPEEGGASRPDALQFVVQKHWASRLHYDFRLELEGTMKSWAVPKGPSFDPADKRMAVHVEDHPISYNQFEGTIPEKQYGAGKVIIWDSGTWTPLVDPVAGYAKGHLKFRLSGHKLRGAWALIRIKNARSKQDAWLLIKEKDDEARPSSEFSVVDEMPDSVSKLKSARPRAAAKAAPAMKARKTASRRTALPREFKPELATLVDAPPADPADWQFEMKFDGYRLLARVDKDVRLITRNGHDWTDRLPHLAKALKSMRVKSGWFDGEIVVVKPGGATSFQELQNAFDSARTGDIVYYLFDLPWYDGEDLTGRPLIERRERLKALLEDAPSSLRFSEAFDAEPADLVTSACKLGLEGIIGKRRDSLYVSRRSPDWIKLKCAHRQEFAIGGWTDPKGSRTGLGALLLGVHDEKGQLKYVGKVGSGFNDERLTSLSRQLRTLATEKSPFAGRVPESRNAHWVKPKLVAEVTFSEWTGDGHLRHPVFHALRTDKPAKSIVREEPVAMLGPDAEEAPQSNLPSRVRVSNPTRVVDASSGLRKIDIVRYYALVGELMMPYLKGRPVSLVKAPQGIAKPMFFQKHVEKAQMEGVIQLPKSLDREHPPYLEVAEPIGLLTAAQMNVIEFHTWNGVKDDIDRPDQVTFDLDPGKGVTWKMLQEAADVMHRFLDRLGLPAWLKTSGGKGLHLMVPIRREYDWATVKSFTQTVVERMAETLPQLFVAKSGPKNRVGRIFIDYLRNGFGATTACAWSVRARPGLGISVPVSWDELASLESGSQWTVSNVHTRLATGNEPWKGFGQRPPSITSAMKALSMEVPKKKAGKR